MYKRQEECAGDGGVFAEAQRPGYRHRCATQRADQCPFTRHVVRLGQQLAHRRAADHRALAGRVLDQVGEVGVAPGDGLEGERSAPSGNVVLQPPADIGHVDAGNVETGYIGTSYVTHRIRTVPAPRLLRRTRRYRAPMSIDVTDATFQAEVIDRSHSVPVVVDLWAPWCGPCQTLGPILEKVVDATGGKVVLVKVDTDQNPGIAQAFNVQSIPAVYALKGGEVVDGFMGAYPEHVVQQFVDGLMPSEGEQAIAKLLATAPTSERISIVHADPGPGNYLHSTGRVTALVDWEFTHLGDAYDDWAYLIFMRGKRVMSPERRPRGAPVARRGRRGGGDRRARPVRRRRRGRVGAEAPVRDRTGPRGVFQNRNLLRAPTEKPLPHTRSLRASGKSEEAALRLRYRPCLLYTSPSPRDRTRSRMPSSA